jgi:hypothetical protein
MAIDVEGRTLSCDSLCTWDKMIDSSDSIIWKSIYGQRLSHPCSFVSNYPTWEPPPNGQKMLGMLSTFRTRNEAASSAFPLASSAVLRNSAPYYPPRAAVSHHFSGSYRGVHSRHGGDGVQFGHRLPVPSGERAVFIVLSRSLPCFLLSLPCFLYIHRAFSDGPFSGT